MKLPDLDFSYLTKLLRETRQNILILTHRNPDGDAIGASLGLSNLLVRLGHTVNVIVPNAIPKFLKWMKGAGGICIYNFDRKRGDELLKNATLVFALDFNDLSRVREFDEKLKGRDYFKVLIDHHPDPTDFADLTISLTEASSTAELVYDFIHEVGLQEFIDVDSASCLYAGIMTDTGCFSFNSSRPGTYLTVAKLLEFGIDKDKIFDFVYNNFSADRMRLMGYCLDKKMECLEEYRTAYISLSQEELRQYNFRIGDSEGFVNLPLSIESIRFSALIMENKDCIKLSFRSKGSFPANRVASEHFAGGGHLNAAGGECYDSLDNTIQKFVNLLPNYRDALLSE